MSQTCDRCQKIVHRACQSVVESNSCENLHPQSYYIRRFFKDKPGQWEIIQEGLTFAEAREHCSSPDSSSRKCTDPDLIKLTSERGDWFDGYDQE